MDMYLHVYTCIGEEQEFGQKNDIIRKKTLDKEEYDLDAFLEELELSEHYHMWQASIIFLCQCFH